MTGQGCPLLRWGGNCHDATLCPRRDGQTTRNQDRMARNQAQLLYYCPVSKGGIADYALAQCEALAELGIEITLLGPRTLGAQVAGYSFMEGVEDQDPPLGGLGRWERRWAKIRLIMRNASILERAVRVGGFRHVLLATYAEYAAPLWCARLERLAHQGVNFGAILHDPIRDYIVGPAWWHWHSVRSAYSFLREVFVHEAVDRQEARIPEGIRITVVPHGPYRFPAGPGTRAEVRAQLGIPGDVFLLLSFGLLRDRKNLHLVLEAMAEFDDVWLLVAGQEAGGVQRCVRDYQQLAAKLGVASRCRWEVGFILPGEVGGLFAAADALVMTYSKEFRSASGVLNAAVHFERPCLVSSGPGPLRTQVEKYGLGVWIEPDKRDAVIRGLQFLRSSPPSPQWLHYRLENSWELNAKLVAGRMLT